MGAWEDLKYFAPRLGFRRAAALAAAKIEKAVAKRRRAAELRRGESDRALLERLGLPAEPAARAEALRGALAPFEGTELSRTPADAARTLAQAQAVTEGRQHLFGREVEVGWPPRWDWRWQGTPLAADFLGDVRSTWELQRLQGLLPLAWAVRAEPARAEEFAGAYLRGVLDFFAAHPGPGGTAHASALEVGLRLIALVQGLLAVRHTQAFSASDLVFLRLLDREARWLSADLSLDKVVRGNHLLGELAGLLVAGCLLPEAQPGWWEGRPVQGLLEAEVAAQFHPDGVSVEQSLTYEKFVLELLLAAAAATAARGSALTGAAAERLLRAADHLEAVTTPEGDLPRVGDCDSGRGAWWGDPDPHRPGDLPARIRSVLGRPATAPSPTALCRFPHGGHLAARTAGGFLFLRGGPFGWGIPGPASHSHMDLLAPVLHLPSGPLLVDPGVYGYGVPEPLRGDLRTAAAHSGPAWNPPLGPEPSGPFRWSHFQLSSGLEAQEGPEGPAVEGWVRYGSHAQALLWHRSMRYNQLDKTWLILDRLSGTAPGSPTWTFHFAPGVLVQPTPSAHRYELRLPQGDTWIMEFDPADETRITTGWVCPAYAERVEAKVLNRRLPPETNEARVRLFPADRRTL